MLLKPFIHSARVVMPQQGALKWAVCRITDGLVIKRFYFKRDAKAFIDKMEGRKAR